MAETAFQTKFRAETIATYEREQSLLRGTVTTEVDINGNQATFLVAGSGDAKAVTRGVNGRIPGRPDNLEQLTCTLTEWHDRPEATGFNIYTSQGDRRQLMQRTAVGVMNRKTDDLIINELLGNATQYVGSTAASPMTFPQITWAQAVLAAGNVPSDGRVTGLITPAARANMLTMPEFINVQMSTLQPLDKMQNMDSFRWLGVNWIVHSGLPGLMTDSEKCVMYHQDAIGHAVDMDRIRATPGYNDEHDYSYVLASAFMGAKVLQKTGIVVFRHSGSGFAPIS